MADFELFEGAPAASKCEAPPQTGSRGTGRLAPQPEKAVAKKSAPLKESSKRDSVATVWTFLLGLLQQLAAALGGEKLAILEQMMERLGEHCRTTRSGSPEATTGKEVMSLLVDLQQTVEDGKDDTAQVEALRAVLESLE